jgi:hypothetical protein
MENIQDYLEIAGMIIAAASAIAAVTPSNTDNEIIAKIMKVVNILGLNVGNAKNKE